MFRKLIAPIRLRFFTTDALLATLDLLDQACLAEGVDNQLIRDRDMSKLMIARELIRRKVIFW